LRDEFVTALTNARDKHRFKLVAWVVMPEHVHVILVPGGEIDSRGSSLPAILIGLKKPLSETIIARWRALKWNKIAAVTDSRGRVHFWQPGGGFDRNVRDADELAREVRYIHQNPVTRGLVPHASDWPWSSARWYAGWPGVTPSIDPISVDRCAFPGPHPEVYLGG
jgi:putative transposase